MPPGMQKNRPVKQTNISPAIFTQDAPGNALGAYETKRHRYELLRSILTNDRSTFLAHWRDLGDYILPRRPRFLITDVNRGDRRNLKIFDSTATLAARTLRSGMMSGVTSPARPWFRLTTPDPDLAEFGPVKEWLYTVTQRMQTIFIKSNIYNCLPIVYGDIGVFGTAAMIIEEDYRDVIRCYAFPIGSYYIATNDRYKVDVFVRDFRMTVRQCVEKFAVRYKDGTINWNNFSRMIKYYWDLNQLDVWVDICHVIEPNPNYDRSKIGAQYKRYSSVYYERGTAGTGTNTLQFEYEDIYLRESGYDYFPVLCPRWEVTGEDVYGTDCPGMTCLGDAKALQTMQKRKSQAIEKMVNPPMTGPVSLKNSKPSILPGDITYVDSMNEKSGFRPVHEVNPRIQELLADIEDHRGRIRRSFYEDLFLMMADSDRREITAREIDERHEEKLLALGPVLEQLNQDQLDPMIDITFRLMGQQGYIPPPPEEIQGMNLNVEYISIMAQAQKLIGIAGIERFAQFAGQVAQFKPEVLDVVNGDGMLETYADMTSVPPGIVNPTDKIKEIRDTRAKQQQIAAMQQTMEQGSNTAKNLSQADTSTPNALTQLLEQANAGNVAPTQ